MPKAAVIVPIYNSYDTLRQCVDSILAQTEGDIEVVLVNDGTPDHSTEIMAAYEAADPRVHCVHQANGGLSAARNAGIAASRAPYLFFVDPDDWIEPELVADALGAAQRHGAQQVIWNYRKAYSDRVEGPYLPMKDEVIDLDTLGLPAYFYRYWFPYVHGQEAWARMYDRALLDAHGLRFVPGQQVFSEDTLMSAKLLLHTHNLVALSRPYLYYRQREGGMMLGQKPQLARRFIALSDCFCQYAQQQGKGDVLKNILPMFCYRLVTKGIAHDPSRKEALSAMGEALSQPALTRQLKALAYGPSVLAYLLNTGKGLRTQLRARLFAHHWLRGNVEGAYALVQRIEGSP